MNGNRPSRPRLALGLEYPLMQQGGTEVLARELVRGLSPHFELVLISGDRKRDELPADLAKLISAHLPWLPEERSAAGAARLAGRLEREKIALAHFHFGGTYEWQGNRFWRSPIYQAARRGIPCVSTNHLAVEWLNCGVHPARPMPYKLLAQAAAWLSRVQIFHQLRLEICVSQHDRRRLVRMFGAFEDKIIQRYHSLLPSDGPPVNLERKPVVLCVGTIGGRKAQPLLVEAFARVAAGHPHWQLDLVGRHDVAADVERIRECVRRNNLQERVHLSGWLPDEQTAARMKAASIFAMPSLQEGLGLSLQEALFEGCVALGTDVGGIPELIDHEINGLLVPPGDVAALEDALERLMSADDFREKLRTQTRPSILRKGMTSAAMIRSYLEIYRGILSD